MLTPEMMPSSPTVGSRGLQRLSAGLAIVACLAHDASAAGVPWLNRLPDDSGTPGFYFDWRKAVPVVAMFLLWVWTLRRVETDATALRIPHRWWNALLFGSGLAGNLFVLCVPSYPFGFSLLLLSYAVPVSWYVAQRNLLVGEPRRAFTVEHLRRLPGDVAATLGTLARRGDAGSTLPVVFLGKSLTGDEQDEATMHAQSSRGHRAAKELIYDAVTRRATDIHLEPKDDVTTVRIRIDGVLTACPAFDRRLGNSVINIFKVLSALDIADKRRSQDGSFRAEVDHRTLDFRVATQGTQHGEKLSIRILDPAHSLATLAALGMRRALQEKVRGCLLRSQGLLLVCGPTGAGKTTTLYAALRELNTREKNVIAVEDPIEYNMPNVNQIEVNTKAGQTFAGALRNLLRQDPDVLLIGEIRDAETATIACQAANTGHMVFSTVHANDTITALYRLLELGVEPFMVGNSVTAILGQRLVRRLCPVCRIPYEPDPHTLEELGLPTDKVMQLYEADTRNENECPACAGSGYLGRVGVFEYLEVSPAIREMIREKAPAGRVLAEAREGGMLLLREEGLGAVARGVISLDELSRVVEEPAE
jgi:type II secretory ATPase GspE/PulE/Tfp pilus assembly ATPase PilB-like protein